MLKGLALAGNKATCLSMYARSHTVFLVLLINIISDVFARLYHQDVQNSSIPLHCTVMLCVELTPCCSMTHPDKGSVYHEKMFHLTDGTILLLSKWGK